MPTLAIFIQHSFRLLSHSIQKEKEIQIGEEVKLSMFADDMIRYTENPKDVTRKLLMLINEFGKTVGYTINNKPLKKSHKKSTLLGH